MGLIDVLTRAAAARAHVLVAEVPGAFEERVALERALDRMGWCMAESVADADVLAVVGAPDEAFAAVVDHVWAQMSEPRVRIHVHAGSRRRRSSTRPASGSALGARRLTGPDVRRGFTPSADAMAHGARRPGRLPNTTTTATPRHDGGHDHSAMMPDGIPLAEGAEDRDGLEMDELHLPLGPVLAHWPAGVVLRVTLHGDVVVDAEVEQLATSRDRPAATTRPSGRRGCSTPRVRCSHSPACRQSPREHDDCATAASTVSWHDGHEVAQLGDRVGRRRVLRWVLGGLIAEGSHGGSEELHDRLTALFERARAELDGGGGAARGTGRPGASCARAGDGAGRGQAVAGRSWTGPGAWPGRARMPEAAHG